MELSHTADLAAIIAMSVAFGRNHRLVWAYAELFGITPLHAKAKKLRLLLEEMKKLFDAGAFTYRKQLYSISAEGIVEALNVVVKKSFPDPLDSHNYLKKVMIGIADREAKAAGRVAEKDLRKTEAGLMAGDRAGDEPYPAIEEHVEAPTPRQAKSRRPESDAEIAANQARARKLINSFGGSEPSRRTP
jgi:hypothetical protein